MDKDLIISEEERKSIVQQIEKFCGEKPYFYLKFTSCKDFAEDIIKGNFYSNTPAYFRELEKDSGVRGQGDQYELINVIELTKFTMRDFETDEIIMHGTGGNVNIKFKDDDSIPLISLVGIPIDDMKLVEYDNNHATFIFPFSPDEYKEMENQFGKYCVIMDGKELEKKVKSYSKSVGCDYIFDKIIYCKQNSLDRIMSFNNSAKERFLYKNEDLKYQREYRIVFAHEIPKEHYINLGKFDNAIIVDSSNLQNFCFDIHYESHTEKD